MAEFYTRGFSSNKGKKALIEDDDFQERDIWALLKEREDSSLKLKIAKDSSSSPLASACRILSVPRVISRVNSLESRAVVHHQFSAPVNIPDWSKIYKKEANIGNYGDDASWAAAYDDYPDNAVNKSFADFLADDEEDGDEMIPPHEFIARRIARSPIVSFSMCEGIGRTLKGRDLSRLRNAILTKTGFLEK